MKNMVMTGMAALCLILGIMAAMGSTWLVPDDDEEMEGGYSLTAMNMDMEEDASCELFSAMMDGSECDGSVLVWSFSDACDATDEDEPCDMATGGMIGTIGMWAGIVCALLVTLTLVLPMAGVDAMDAMPDMGKKIASWGAGALMLVGILGWYMMLPDDGEMAMGMSSMMAIGAALLGLAAAAMDQFMDADE